MNNDLLIEKARKKAFDNERNFGGCSQCVVGALKDTLGVVSNDVFKAATGLGGGIGLTGRSCCGALTGGVMVIGTFLGREYDNFADPGRVRFETFKLAKRLVEKFEEEYGSVVCDDIKIKIMGRKYDLCDEKEFQEFLNDGGHDDKCPSVCGNGAKWTVEILSQEKLI